MEILRTTITLRKAEMWDVFHGVGQKRIGQPFWVKSQVTGQVDNRGYIVERSTSAKELQTWVEQGMLYVPASDLDIQKENKKPVAPSPVPAQNELSLAQ